MHSLRAMLEYASIGHVFHERAARPPDRAIAFLESSYNMGASFPLLFTSPDRRPTHV